MSAARVAVDVGPLAGRRTGIGVAVAALLEALGRRDDVELVSYLTSFRARPEAGVTRLPLPAALAHRLWAPLGWPRVDRWLGDVEVVHGTNYVVPPSRHPRLVSVYDCWFLDHPADAHPDVRRAGAVLRRALADGAVVHACSQATAAAVLRHVPRARVVTVPLAPIELPAPSAGMPFPRLDGVPFVVAIGTLERRKNLPVLVRAFGALATDHPDLHLVLAGGDGDDRIAIDAEIARLDAGVAARVVVTGWIADDVRSWLLHHASALAYPSLDEGFGFPLLDAMQAGLPIVATRVGSIPEVAGDAAVLVERPADHVALASSLAQVLHDGALRERLRSAGTERLASFSWDATAAAIASTYHDLRGAPTGARRPTRPSGGPR